MKLFSLITLLFVVTFSCNGLFGFDDSSISLVGLDDSKISHTDMLALVDQINREWKLSGDSAVFSKIWERKEDKDKKRILSQIMPYLSWWFSLGKMDISCLQWFVRNGADVFAGGRLKTVLHYVSKADWVKDKAFSVLFINENIKIPSTVINDTGDFSFWKSFRSNIFHEPAYQSQQMFEEHIAILRYALENGLDTTSPREDIGLGIYQDLLNQSSKKGHAFYNTFDTIGKMIEIIDGFSSRKRFKDMLGKRLGDSKLSDLVVRSSSVAPATINNKRKYDGDNDRPSVRRKIDAPLQNK